MRDYGASIEIQNSGYCLSQLQLTYTLNFLRTLMDSKGEENQEYTYTELGPYAMQQSLIDQELGTSHVPSTYHTSTGKEFDQKWRSKTIGTAAFRGFISMVLNTENEGVEGI
jgi:hypothetical protein